MPTDTPTAGDATTVVLNQRSATAPYRREAINIQGDENPGKAIGFDGDGVLTAISAGNEINVKDYGADPTGDTNATPAIQAAIDAAASGSGGVVRIPSGTYKLEAGLNLTGIGNGKVSIVGDSRLSSALMCAFDGGSALDLTGSSRVHLANFAINKVAGFAPDQMLLLARKATNASAGNHLIENLHIDGTCNNASVVVWGSEVNTWTACDIRSSVNKPALVCAVKISELGFTPTSSIVGGIGTGSGGVGVNTFVGCIFNNLMETIQSSPLLRLFGANAWNFTNCYFYSDANNTVEINASSGTDDPNYVYYARVTFDNCEDETVLFPTGNKNTILLSAFPATASPLREGIRGLHIRNCAFLNIFGADNSIVDNFVYDGGRYSPSVTFPTAQTKISLWRAYNSLIAPSLCECGQDYVIRNAGSALTCRGITAARLSLTGVTGSTIIDDLGKITFIFEDAASRYTIDGGAAGIVTFDAFGPADRFYFNNDSHFTNGQIVTGGAAVASPALTIDGSVNRRVIFQAADSVRWVLHDDNTSFRFDAHDDAGSILSPPPITLGRAAGTAVTLGRPLTMLGTTVAGLATAVPSPLVGMHAYVTDALGPAYLATVVGGGAVKCPVFYNGTNWVCH